MTTSDDASLNINELLARRSRDAEILAGALPTVEELLAGYPPAEGKLDRDIWIALGAALSEPGVSDSLRDALTVARSAPTVGTIAAAIRELPKRAYGFTDLSERLQIYAAFCGDLDARKTTGIKAIRSGYGSPVDEAHAVEFGMGLLTDDRYRQALDIMHAGRFWFADAGKLIARRNEQFMRAARAELAESEPVADETLRLLAETISVDESPEPDAAPEPPEIPAGIIVVPELKADKLTGWRKEIAKSWKDLAGESMPLVTRGDVAAHRRALVDRWPHAADVIDVILRDLAPRDEIKFRPTLIVGKPGSGKSALARAIAETVGLPCELQSFAGLHDGALMGTSAQWSSARESAPLQLIKRSGVANPAIIWDEIEKASSDRRNGAPAEALLPMLERDQAAKYRDLCLEVECDLSWVSHFATANSLDGIPDPVRDRMRILTMPEPDWQHLGALTRNILSRIADDRGIDPRWLSPLAEDEFDLVRNAWPGGSLRRLRRAVEVVIDGRDRCMARA